MQFGILGPTQAWGDDGHEVAVGGPRLRALLARLLVDPGQAVGTERLIDDLYGEQPPAGAANALQSQVSRLRRALPDASLVELHPAGYQLAVDPADVDVHRFTRLATDGHRALAAGDHAGAAALLAEALRLWRGPALADVTGAPFAPAQAVRLAEARLGAREDRYEAELALGEHRGLVPDLQELVTAHPLRERLRGQLMRALAGSGRQAEALQVYEEARRALAEELGADPSPELAAVHRAVLRADDSLTAPAPATPPRHRLPAPLTSFVGREEELRRVGTLLSGARLVTLTGPGGAGKTRLAVEAAGRSEVESCYVELAPLVAGAGVPYAVLAALGLREGGLRDGGPRDSGPREGGPRAAAGSRPTLLERLVAALTSRRLLLVLDNCEHVVAGVAELVDRLLRACPTLRVLATSREPLGLTGEALCPLSGLGQPPPGGGERAGDTDVDAGDTDVDPVRALAYPAVRLFADRATEVAPGFSLAGTQLATVLRICRALDGLPLAIELAAARLRSLSLAEVGDRLDDRFALLSRGSRTAQPRHRSLRAVVEWSWDLLTPPEQELLRRLAGFAGGATLDAAERVTGLPVVDTLASLVDKSLVESAGGRYRMLETVRAYAAERLAEAGETERLRRVHAGYFLDLAWTADPHLRRAEQVEWLARLDAERDNLHVALRGAVAAGDPETALELVAALSSYWWLRGLRGEAGSFAAQVLAAVGPQPPPGREEEYALCVLNAALAGAGDPALRGRTDSFARVLRDPERPPRQPVLYLLSALATGPPGGDPTDREASGLAEPDPLPALERDPWSRALGRMGAGYLQLWTGRVAAAEPLFAEALAGFRALGERWGMTSTLAALAEVAAGQGDRAGSVTLIDEALRLAGELGSTVDTADLLRLRGDGAVRAGDLAAAHADYQRSLSYARRAGALDTLAAARHGLAEVARWRGDLAEARRQTETGLAECPTGWFTADENYADLLAARGRIAEAEGETGAAAAQYRAALGFSTGTPGLVAQAGALEGLLRLALDRPDLPGERVALLVGAATTLVGPELAGGDGIGRIAETVRARLGDQDYQAAFARGAGMSRAQAYAVLAESPSGSG